MEVLSSIANAIGNTPIVKLSRLGAGLGHSLLAKCEFLNPGGSIKDRIAKYMVERAEADGRLSPGGTIIEATAGNTGVGLAMLAALKGYKLITVMSSKVSRDKVRLLEVLGSQVVIVPSGKKISDPEHFQNKARALAASTGAWLVDQFNNEDNVLAHYQSTGPEIWRQTQGAVDVLVAGVGTGGTLTGAGRYLKECNPNVKLVLADPIGSGLAAHLKGEESLTAAYLVEGIGSDVVPKNFDPSLVDSVLAVSDDESIAAAYRLMREEGIFAGSSAGCITAAAMRFCEGLSGPSRNVVAILPDGGRAYMSTIYDENWLSEKLVSRGA